MMPQQLDSLMVDSVYVSNPPLCGEAIPQSGSWVDTVLAIAMAVIAAVNVGLTIYIFVKGRKDSSESDYKKRKFELMQTLILNSNIDKFYKFYDNVSASCRELLSNTDQQTKDEVNKSIKADLKLFRLEFITLVKVIDTNLYDNMIQAADTLIDGITKAIYDDGLNLKNEPKFDEVVTRPISKCRTDCLTMLLQIAEQSC